MIIFFTSVTFMCDIVRRNKMLVTLTGLKVKNLPREEGWDVDMFWNICGAIIEFYIG